MFILFRAKHTPLTKSDGDYDLPMLINMDKVTTVVTVTDKDNPNRGRTTLTSINGDNLTVTAPMKDIVTALISGSSYADLTKKGE